MTDKGFLNEPLEKVRKYIADPNALSSLPFLRGGRVVDKKGDIIVFENVIVKEGGKGTDLATLKLTINAPEGYDVEYLSGPLVGSKFSRVYTGMGHGTKAEISGDFRMRGADEETTKKGILELLDETMKVDARNLKKYE